MKQTSNFRFTFSKTSSPGRTSFKNAPMRRRAFKYADDRFARGDLHWKVCLSSFMGGYLYANRLRNAELRVLITQALGKAGRL